MQASMNSSGGPTKDPSKKDLGHLVFFSVPECKISHEELALLFDKNKISKEWVPNEPAESDAFRRAVTVVNTEWKKDPIPLKDGNRLIVMIRDVTASKSRIHKHLIGEILDSQNERLSYGKLGDITFLAQGGIVSGTVDPQAPSNVDVQQILDSIFALYEENKKHHNGTHIRSAIRKIIKSTDPILMRGSGGVYFVPIQGADTIEELEHLVTDLAPYQTTQSAVPGLEAIPVEDSTKQRASIKAHFEEENLEEINGIMAELSQVLTSDKHITLKTATGYVESVKELTAKIEKFESILESKLTAARDRRDILKKQAVKVVDKVSLDQDSTQEVQTQNGSGNINTGSMPGPAGGTAGF